jgi:hypothetical protein
LIVFLFRFVESQRVVAEQLGRNWWRWVDPLYWFCYLYYAMLLAVSAPILRRQELHADSVSAAAYGGDLAVHTLLEDWYLENQFNAAVEAYSMGAASQGEEPPDRPTVYRYFRDCFRDFSAAGEEYLEQRLLEEPEGGLFEPSPSMRRRIKLMRTYPDSQKQEYHPAADLLADVDQVQCELNKTFRAHVKTGERRA